MSVRVVNKLPSFKHSVYDVMDDAIKEAAKDGFIDAKTHAPFSEGALRSNADFKKVKPLHQRIRFWMEYARFQEFGGDAKRRVRKYSSSGTGAHYLKNAGDKQAKKLGFIFKKHGRRARP